MADIVRFGADASDYFNVVDRMRGSLRGLGSDVRNTSGAAATGFQAGADGGGLMGFLKGERAVKGQAKFLVAGLLEARDASAAAESALQAFVYSARVGLGGAVAAVAVFTAYKLVTEELEKAKEAQDAFNNATSLAPNLVGQLGAGAFTRVYEEALKQHDAYVAHVNSTPISMLEGFQRAFGGGAVLGMGTTAGDERTMENLRQQRVLADIAKQRGEAELKIAEAKARVVEEGTQEAELALSALTFSQKKAELKLTPDAGLPQRTKALDVEATTAANEIKRKHADEEKKRLKESADFELKNLDDYYDKKENYEKKFEAALRARAKEIIKDAADQAQAARDILTLKKSATDPTGLLADVGKIAQDPQAYQKRLEAQIKQEQAGQALIDAAKAEQARQQAGFAPTITADQAEMFNRILDATKAQEKATSLEELSKMDFSAIAKLGDPALDFSGIEALAGLTIVVQ